MNLDHLSTYAIVFLGVLLVVYQIVIIRFTIVRVEHKINLLLMKFEIDPLAQLPLSDRVKELAREPGRKIEAIYTHRKETGAGLAEAKSSIESYIASLEH